MKYKKGDIIMVDDRRAKHLIVITNIVGDTYTVNHPLTGENKWGYTDIDNITKKVGEVITLEENLFAL